MSQTDFTVESISCNGWSYSYCPRNQEQDCAASQSTSDYFFYAGGSTSLIMFRNRNAATSKGMSVPTTVLKYMLKQYLVTWPDWSVGTYGSQGSYGYSLDKTSYFNTYTNMLTLDDTSLTVIRDYSINQEPSVNFLYMTIPREILHLFLNYHGI